MRMHYHWKGMVCILINKGVTYSAQGHMSESLSLQELQITSLTIAGLGP